MSDRLTISAVNAERFGGLSKAQLQLPDAPVVVVFAHNEAGKSTFSELIAWLLVGPSSRSDVVRRFGTADEVLKGSLTGTLRGADFTATAEFKVTPSGNAVSTKSLREYEFGGALKADQWLQHIGRLDQQALAGIYRIWGQQLHDGGDAENELRRAGLGVLVDSADPRELAKKLEALAKTGAKVGPDGSSFKSLAAELRSISTELREAEANVEKYKRAEEAIAALEARRKQYEATRDELVGSREQLIKVSDLETLRHDLESAEDAVRTCLPLADDWATVVDDPSALRMAVSDCRSANAALDQARLNFRSKLTEAGVDASATAQTAISSFKIIPADAGPVAAAVSNVSHATVALDRAIAHHAAKVAALEAAVANADVAMAELSTDADALRASSLHPESRIQLVAFSQRFSELVGAADLAEGARGDAAVASAAANFKHDQALHAWDLLGVGCPARDWISGAAGTASRRFDSPWIWVMRAVMIISAVVAAVAAQWLVAALAAAATVISWMGRSEPIPVVDGLEATALSVIEAEQALDSALVEERRASAQLEVSRDRVTGAETELSSLGKLHGVRLPADPRLLSGAISRWADATDLLGVVDSTQTAVEIAAQEAERAAEVLATTKTQLDELLTGFGLPEGILPDAAQAKAESYISLLVSANLVRDCELACTRAEQARLSLVTPVAEEVEAWSLEKLLDHAGEAEERLTAIRLARSGAEDARRILEGALGNDHELRRVFDEQHSDERLQGEIKHISEEIEVTRVEINETSAEIGQHRKLLESLRGVERMADLRLSHGSLVETQSEVATELAVNRLAGVILRSVADDYERENQPELVKQTGALASRVAGDWQSISVKATGADSSELRVRMTDGTDVSSSVLSTGARALLYLSLRLAMADDDGRKRQIQMPLLCDDPLVHLDDQRALTAMELLSEAGQRRQVVVFTCHQRTADAATALGATIVRL